MGVVGGGGDVGGFYYAVLSHKKFGSPEFSS